MEERLREATRSYLDVEDALKRLEEEKKRLEQQQAVYQTAIHMSMRELDIDEINVRNMKFSRVVKNPGARQRRAPLKDMQLVGVLKKHLVGEDGKLREVLEDIAQMRAPPPKPEEPAHEVLIRRVTRKA